MLAAICVAAMGQGSMFASVIPNPTGRNGYEEYVRASEIASSAEFRAYMLWLERAQRPELQPGYPIPPDLDPKSSDLEIRQVWTTRFELCCRLIAAGNDKPVTDPRGTIKPDTLLPEFAGFRSLARFEASTAQVDFADGLTNAAVRHLEDGIVFGGKIGSALLIGRLVGIATDSILFKELDEHWAQLDLADAHELELFFGRRIAGPSLLIDSLNGERRAIDTAIELVFDSATDATSLAGDDEDFKSALKQLAALSPQDSADAHAAARTAADGYIDSAIATMNGPESGWLSVGAPPEARSNEGSQKKLADQLASAVLPDLSSVAVREAQDRTRMRLAFLSAKAVEYRWVHGRLPDNIEEFASESERTDPSSGHAFRYRLDGPWFKITRENKDAMGSVGMVNPPMPPDPNASPLKP